MSGSTQKTNVWQPPPNREGLESSLMFLYLTLHYFVHWRPTPYPFIDVVIYSHMANLLGGILQPPKDGHSIHDFSVQN